MNTQTTLLHQPETSIHTSFVQADRPRQDKLTVVLLHGAGQSNSERFTALAELFAHHGIPSVRLDFIGHGETGGEVSDNKLRLRTEHALAAIDHWVDVSTPLILCGSSMSGHTALRVAAQLGARVESLCLLQPAVYATQAEDVFFGPDFTKILREHESWRSSLALQDAASFKGRALVVIGADDSVIPWGVIEALVSALKEHSSAVRLDVINGVGHELATWIPNNAEFSRQLIDYLVAYER